mgnify:CR=1 FL=1
MTKNEEDVVEYDDSFEQEVKERWLEFNKANLKGYFQVLGLDEEAEFLVNKKVETMMEDLWECISIEQDCFRATTLLEVAKGWVCDDSIYDLVRLSFNELNAIRNEVEKGITRETYRETIRQVKLLLDKSPEEISAFSSETFNKSNLDLFKKELKDISEALVAPSTKVSVVKNDLAALPPLYKKSSKSQLN